MRNNNGALFRASFGKHIAFTLAEMMVVMLILSIIMAAFAPIMTRRSKADMNNRSPWQYVDGENSGNIYFNAAGDSVVAMLGAKLKTDDLASPRGKFIINAGSSAPYALRFQYEGTDVGGLRMTADTVSLGSTYTSAQTPGTGVTAVGQGISLQGDQNTSIGYQALASNTSGSGNVANGYRALYNNTNSNNTATGYQALLNNTSGSGNVANGFQALLNNTSGSGNVATGYQALLSNNGSSNNVAVGNQAMSSTASSNNVAIGNQAMHSVGSNGQNVAIGNQAMYKDDSGYYNVAIGHQTMYKNGDGDYIVAIGYQALYNNVNGDNITAIGHNACLNVTGSNKTCIGAGSGPDSSEAEASNNANVVYIGDSNSTVYIKGNLVVAKNTGLGINGYSKVAFRMQANGGDYAVQEADDDRHTRFSDNGRVGGNGDVSFSNAFINSYTVTSDRRLKNISGANNDGLDKLMQLNVFNFTFKQDKKKMPHVGVIAQDLQKVFPNAVMKDKKGYFMIRWDEMFYCMLNSIKELATKVTNIDSRVTKLEKENQALKTQNQMLEKRLVRLEKKVK